jgi:aryl-alcohol dehydrogenase-like predicted oxidoreductase
MRSPAELIDGDLRRGMPRFQSPNFEENRRLLAPLDEIAAEARCTRAQLALAWVLARHPHTLVIPGTTREGHLTENCGADAIRLDAATIQRLEALLPPGRALGERYPPATQVENDTEEIVQRA